MKPIRKAVFPVAGLGTRFLPATKAMPKEMLPIIDKPLIQYAVEEAIAAGITELIFVTGRHKRSIEDHFDRLPELEAELANKSKNDLLDCVKSILPSNVTCIYIRQGEPLGLGHAVLCAKPAVGDEPFAVILADDLIDAKTAVVQQLVEAAHCYNGSIMAVQTVEREETDKYGIIAGTELNGGTVTKVQSIVEKPAPDQAPSLNAVVGRYVFEPEIFSYLEKTQPGKGSEIQLTDAISAMLADKPVFGLRYEGARYDCGSKAGFFQATVAYGKKYHGFQIL